MTTIHSRSTISWLRAASAALALFLVPALASAQTAPVKKQNKKVLAQAVPAGSAAATPSSQPFSPIYVGALVGVDFPQNYSTGFKILGYVGAGVTQLAPQLNLDVLAHFGYAYNSGPSLTLAPGVSSSSSLHLFELVPAARLRYTMTDVLQIYGDAGLGIAFLTGSVTTPAVGIPGTPFFIPATDTSSTTTTGVFRISGGILYALTPEFSVQFEPVGLNFYFAGGSTTHYTLTVGGTYRL